MTQSTLSLETVATYPLPGLDGPSGLRYTPDGQWITYLQDPDGGLNQKLFGIHLETGETQLLADATDAGATEENLSLEEKLRRERLRQRALGITSYTWNRRMQALIPLPTGLFVLDQPGGELRPLLSSQDGPILDPRFSPDGRWVAFVQNSELHLIPTDGGEPRQLTHGALESGKTNGLAEFMAQEEMDRRQGYWWAPDSQKIAFAEVDETHIPPYRIMHQGRDQVGDEAQEDHRYPFAGQPNAYIRLGVVPIEGGQPVWMELGEEPDIYLARVHWASDRLLVQRLNREQTVLDLLLFDPTNGKGQRLLCEKTTVWINLHNHFRAISRLDGVDTGGFLWASERTGYMHLYLYSWEGELIRPLTSGDWLVDEVHTIDVDQQIVYFSGTLASPTEKQLYRVSLAGGEIEQISSESGMHKTAVSIKSGTYIDTISNIHHPPVTTLHNLSTGAPLRTLVETADLRLEQYELPPPEIVTLQNRSGDTLYGALYRPPASFGPGPYPTIVSVYGGPHAQRVTNQWLLTVDMRAQFLSQHGYLVFKLDNRGSARRGLAFEGHIKHNLGDLELQDQVDGVHWLVENGLADADRVGIYGWSYGGYMAAMALARASETFKTAVSGAPVTHWDGYDTCYTERYMGTPQSNPDGYKISSVMHHVDKLKGSLLLVHGLIDENVHFRHTARLINALIAAQKPYELMLFPNERHMPRSLADRIYMEKRLLSFFEATL